MSGAFKGISLFLRGFSHTFLWFFSSVPAFLILIAVLLSLLFVFTLFSYKSKYSKKTLEVKEEKSDKVEEPVKGEDKKTKRFHHFLDILSSFSSASWLILRVFFAVFILFLFSLLFEGFAKIGDKASLFLERRQQVHELSLTLAHLLRSQKVAEIEVLSYKGGISSLSITIFDGSAAARPLFRRFIDIAGRDIYIDSAVLNFDYALIETGTRQNIAIPYRIYSDKVAQVDAFSLGTLGEDGVPYFFMRPPEELVGLSPEAFRETLESFLSLALEAEALQKKGVVRSLYGSALHRTMRPGERWTLWSESSGGLSLRNSRPF